MNKMYAALMMALALLVGMGMVVVGPAVYHSIAGENPEQIAGPGPDCEKGMGFGMGIGRHEGRMARMLNLTKEQTEKMTTLKKAFFNETKPLRDELFQKRAEARKLYSDPKADEASIMAKQKEVSSLQQKFHDRMIQLKLEERRILTPEQLKKLGEIPMKKHMGRHCGEHRNHKQ